MKNLKTAFLLLALTAPTLGLAEELPASGPAATPAAAAPAETAPATAPAGAPTGAAANTPAPAATASGALAALEEAEKKGGFALSADLDHSLGTGTFISPSMYSSFGATLSVVPRYGFFVAGKSISASLALRAAWEYTLPDNENGRRFAPGDSRLGFSAPGLYKNELTGIVVSPSIGFLIPTSPESWTATLITNISAGLSLSKTAGRFNFALSTSGSRGFHLRTASVLAGQPSSAGARIDAFQARQNAEGAAEPYVSFSAWNTAWSFNVGGNASFQTTDELSFVVGFSYGRSWKYNVSALGPNETLPANARLGMGESDRTSAVVAVNYQLTDHYGVSLSASTVQAPRSGAAGGAGYFRFPFWAIYNAADNATNISFTFSASY